MAVSAGVEEAGDGSWVHRLLTGSVLTLNLALMLAPPVIAVLILAGVLR